MFLDKIVAVKKQELQSLYEQKEEIIRQSQRAGLTRDFLGSLRSSANPLALIAEVKKASPSKGLIRPDFHPQEIASAYQRGGADAISVLTDIPFFQGSPEYLTQIRSRVRLPVFRKDFILDELQVYQSRAMGADALLLIAAILDKEQMRELYRLAHRLGMQVLIEVHNEAELEQALSLDPPLIGINNRNLHTFVTELSTTEKLMPLIPDRVLVVSESGISTPEHIAMLREVGAGAVLVGEHLMRQQDVEQAVRQLMGRSTDGQNPD